MFRHIVNSDIDYYILKFLFITDIANLKLVRLPAKASNLARLGR